MELPPVSWRRGLLAAGYTDHDLRQLRRDGQLAAVRRGAYVAAADPRLAQAVARHRLLVEAALPTLVAGRAAVSHASAAVLYGLPLWAVPLQRVHVTRDQDSGGRIGGSVHLHTAPLRSDELVVLDGVAMTSPARTVVDLARTSGFESAVVVADAALHGGLVSAEELSDAVVRARGWLGAPKARWVLAFADGRAESVGESRSRVALMRAGLPEPVLQWEVWCEGKIIARVDFAWPELHTVGEFDGKVKYGRLLRPDEHPGDAVFAEKLREDRLRAMGLTVCRWTWPDLTTFTPVATRIRAAFQR